MRFPNEAKVFVFLVLFLFAGTMLSQHWHSFSFINPETVGVSLEAYPKIVGDQNVCFNIALEGRNVYEERSFSLTAFTDAKTLFSGMVSPVYSENMFRASDFYLEKEICFSGNEIPFGHSRIFVESAGTRLFFNLEKVENYAATNQSIELNDFNSTHALFSVSDYDFGKNHPIILEIEFEDGEKEKRKIYPSNSNQKFAERIDLFGKPESFAVSLAAMSVRKELPSEQKIKLIPFIGILLFSLMAMAFYSMVFSNREFFERSLLSLVFTCIVLIVNGFVLNAVQFLSIESFALVFIAEICAIAFAFRKQFVLSYQKVTLNKGLFFVGCVLFALLVPLLFHLFSNSYFTYWNGFYERHSLEVISSFGVPLMDSLSFFGRGFTFVPGYFFLEAGISWLTGLEQAALFAFMICLGNLLFILAVFNFTKSFDMPLRKGPLIYFFLAFSMFIFTGMSLSPRHIISLSFLLTTVALMEKHKNGIYSSIVLAFNGFIQIPMLIFFPIIYAMVSKKPDFRKLARNWLIGLGVFLVLFSPNFYFFGMPHEARMADWGYLIRNPFINKANDVGMLFILVLLYCAYLLVSKKEKFTHYRKKIVLSIVAALLIESLITYRFNIGTSILVAVFIADVFPLKKLMEPKVQKILSVFVVISIFASAGVIYFWTMPAYAMQPFDYMQSFSSDDRILSDPLFGHSISFYAKRPVLSDLYVEYADEEKLSDTYNFLEYKDYSILKKHKIKYVVNQRNLINKTAMNNSFLENDLEFENMDKIYSNNFLFIHRNSNLVGN